MGSVPRQTEAAGLVLLRDLIGDRFEIQYGHEVRADVFVRPKPGNSAVSAEHKRWVPVQLKVTSAITKAWKRKMKFIVRRDKQKLHEIILVGLSLHESDPCFVHQIHANRAYDKFDVLSPHHTVTPSALGDKLQEFWDNKVGTSMDHPQHSFAFSPATLTEQEARSDFVALLSGSEVSYEVARGEGDPVDGYVFLQGNPGRKWRVQEKVLALRYDRGKPIGLRCVLRRSTGSGYTVDDADYLLLHAREDPDCADVPFRIFGCAFISFEELRQRGYLHVDDANPGKSILSLYPDAPGVRNPRSDWAEERFARRTDVPDLIATELANKD